MTAENADWGNKALSKVAEIGISSQLDEVEAIDVDIRTNPGKLMQGKLDSVTISGKGLVMKQDVRLETLEISIDKVSIDPLRAVFGNLELTHPTDAEAYIVLTETDLNRAFSCEYIQAKLRNLKMNVNGQQVTIDLQQATIELPGDNKFVIHADFLVKEQGELKKLSVTAIPQIHENGNRISLEILAIEGQGLILDLVSAIVDRLTALLDLRNFDIPGISFQLYRLEAQKDRLVIHSQAQVAQIPDPRLF
jgi:LmeA-like phospholipid-binding